MIRLSITNSIPSIKIKLLTLLGILSWAKYLPAWVFQEICPFISTSGCFNMKRWHQMLLKILHLNTCRIHADITSVFEDLSFFFLSWLVWLYVMNGIDFVQDFFSLVFFCFLDVCSDPGISFLLLTSVN